MPAPEWLQHELRDPLDPFPYDQDPRARLASAPLADGLYVFVVNRDGDLYVLEDGPHRHPKVLGYGLPARYAGDLSIENGGIADLTNLSGTFQFDDADGLLLVAQEFESLGFFLHQGAVRLFPADGSLLRVLR